MSVCIPSLQLGLYINPVNIVSKKNFITDVISEPRSDPFHDKNARWAYMLLFGMLNHPHLRSQSHSSHSLLSLSSSQFHKPLKTHLFLHSYPP